MTETRGFQAQSLTCHRGGRLLFTGVNINLSAGDALLISGRNGVGKTSLLRQLSGLVKPDEGRLNVNGTDADDDPERYRSHISYLGHRNALKPALTVSENINFWAKLRAGTSIDEALDALNITHLADTPVRLLSSGQKRRSALARLHACGASLWLLDEPSTGLDTASRQRLDAMIANHRGKGGMVIAVAHGDLQMADAKDLRLEENAA
jgi:heme exporter protein A